MATNGQQQQQQQKWQQLCTGSAAQTTPTSTPTPALAPTPMDTLITADCPTANNAPNGRNQPRLRLPYHAPAPPPPTLPAVSFKLLIDFQQWNFHTESLLENLYRMCRKVSHWFHKSLEMRHKRQFGKHFWTVIIIKNKIPKSLKKREREREWENNHKFVYFGFLCFCHN